MAHCERRLYAYTYSNVIYLTVRTIGNPAHYEN